jgi:hypothetical protein
MSRRWVQPEPGGKAGGAGCAAALALNPPRNYPVNPPIQAVIDTGVVPRVIELFSPLFDHLPLVQFEVRLGACLSRGRRTFKVAPSPSRPPSLPPQAAWVITNIAAGTRAHTHVVMDSGAIPPLLRLLGSPADDVREQAAWALGNIAGDSPETRDAVLGAGALAPLLALLSGHANMKPAMLRTFTWTLANFCRGIPQPAFELVKSALPALAALIHSQAESPAA